MVWQDFNEKVFRFAVLKHVRQTDIHWDLLLQLPDRPLLATWQIRVPPAVWISRIEAIPAVAIADHRLIYLDFEGEIPGDRGNVKHVDGGILNLQRVEENAIRGILRGHDLKGPLTLTRTKSDCADVSQQWQLKFGTACQT
ncbi:MAG: DNA polymerase ligase N-terminal domain-containing protein [Phycisphaerae bacterium]